MSTNLSVESNLSDQLNDNEQKGRSEMIRNLDAGEMRLLRFYVRNFLFTRIKFAGHEQLSQDSFLIDLLFKQINVTNDEDKRRKYLGVRYVLQRQLNSKRNYCTDKIVKECKGKYKITQSCFY
jgi:hypothetical protein